MKGRRKRRERKRQSTAPQRRFDSMSAAAAALKVPMSLLARAKKLGAPGFRDTRVHIDLLKPWLEANEAAADFDDKTALECKRLRQKIEHEQFDFERSKGEWERKADTDAFMSSIAARIKSVSIARLKNELPPQLEGLRAPEIAAKMDTVIAELIELFRR